MLEDNHVHKYMGVKFPPKNGAKKGYEILKCMHPDCNHFIPRPLGIGKRSICWVCEKAFVIDAYSIRLKKPHCTTCSRFPEGVGRHGKKREPIIPLMTVEAYLKKRIAEADAKKNVIVEKVEGLNEGL